MIIIAYLPVDFLTSSAFINTVYKEGVKTVHYMLLVIKLWVNPTHRVVFIIKLKKDEKKTL